VFGFGLDRVSKLSISWFFVGLWWDLLLFVFLQICWSLEVITSFFFLFFFYFILNFFCILLWCFILLYKLPFIFESANLFFISLFALIDIFDGFSRVLGWSYFSRGSGLGFCWFCKLWRFWARRTEKRAWVLGILFALWFWLLVKDRVGFGFEVFALIILLACSLRLLWVVLLWQIHF
jgi:hypothetical protein